MNQWWAKTLSSAFLCAAGTAIAATTHNALCPALIIVIGLYFIWRDLWTEDDEP